MFSAITIKNKAGRWFENSDCEDFDWRQSIRRLEDSLTSFVFDTLMTMRGTTISSILAKASNENISSFKWLGKDNFSINYWPSYKYKNKLVEPDVVISDLEQKRLLVVEVKWGGIQTVEQIEKQIECVKTNHHDCKLIMLLLGGNNSRSIRNEVKSESWNKLFIYNIEWNEFQLALKIVIDTNTVPSEKRALKYLHRGLKWYGIRFFQGFDFENLCIPNEETEFFEKFRFNKKHIKGFEHGWFSDFQEFPLLRISLPKWSII